MTPQDFEFVANLVRQKSGLSLSVDKGYLVESRLGPLARREGMASIDDLVKAVKLRSDARLIAAIVDAMTTNETFFFRDKTPFDTLKNVILPQITKANPGKRLTIWCAAASTGQEPYTIAMVIDQMAGQLNGCTFDIVGTDISERVLEKAKAGLYTQFEVQRGLPVQMLLKYFAKVGEGYKIDDRLRAMVRFKPANLLESLMPLGKFDIVFCRNVLIYFDTATKRGVLQKIAAQSNDPGYLLLGAAETVLGVSDAYQPVSGTQGLYQRAGAGQTARVPLRAAAG